MCRQLSSCLSCCHSLVSWSQARIYYATRRVVAMSIEAPWCSRHLLLALAGEPV